MLYIYATREDGQVVSAEIVDSSHPAQECRWDWETYAKAQEIAAALNLAAGKVLYVATDAGAHCSPRYDVQKLPQVGDDVSYAFNGDSYPCGKITKISAGPDFRRIETQEVLGNGAVRKEVFYRRCRDGKATGGAWVLRGTWSLVIGHISKTNPEF